MTREPDVARLLLRALHRSAAAAGCAPTLHHEALVPWASATFVGGRHRVTVQGDGLAAWLAALPEADLPLPGHFVASCAVEPVAAGATLAVLVLVE